MTTEQAIKYLSLYIKINDKRAIVLTKEELKFKLEEDFTQKVSEAIQVVLKELDKKDKVINEMANEFAENMKAVNEEYAVDEEFLSKGSIKDYFYKKVEEQE